MSKLFKALESLEKQAEEGGVVERVESFLPQRRRRAGRPYWKIWLLTAVFGLLGIGSVALFWKVADGTLDLSWLIFQNVISPAATEEMADAVVAPEPQLPAVEEILPAPEMVPGPREVQLPPGEIVKADQPENVAQSHAKEDLNHNNQALQQEDTSEDERATASPEVTNEMSGQGEVVVQALPEPSDAADQKELAAMRSKKLLYQAERARSRGNMILAVQLFKEAWDLGRNPAVANNLAAALITMKQYHEALAVLDQALRLAPEDPDLLYNRNIARENL